jgi:hypothetical protein
MPHRDFPGGPLTHMAWSSTSLIPGVCCSSGARRATGLKPPDCLRHKFGVEAARAQQLTV